MNIFVLDTDPRIAASMHCDTHVVKMILESTQILCTVRHMAGSPVPNGYKPTHQDHPCTRWAAERISNQHWLQRLLFWLHAEYESRYEKVHASKRLVDALMPLYPTHQNLSPFVFCGPDQCVRDSVVESYRALYRLKATTMKRPMRWTRSPRPEWMNEALRMEDELIAALIPYGYTLRAVPDFLDDGFRRLEISCPGKMSRGCSYDTRLLGVIRAAQKCMIHAAQQGLDKDA